MVTWLVENPVLYDRSQGNYHKTDRDAMWERKVAEMQLENCDWERLFTWYKGLRDRYFKMTHPKKTGSAAVPDEDRTAGDRWILRNFQFLRGHANRHHRRQAQRVS